MRRANAIKIVKELKDKGYTAYFAGGCVRDFLLEVEPKDYDIATNATPEVVESLFDKTISVGKSFGVIIVVIEGEEFEVATFRSDGKYSDGRRPDNVMFTSPKNDSQRRDFTINGLFYDPVDECLIDYVKGTQDLFNGVIRFIGNPLDRIKEDPLRILRAIRFNVTLKFNLEDSSFNTLKNNIQFLNGVSRERVGQEFEKMACDYGHAIYILDNFNLLKYVLPKTSKDMFDGFSLSGNGPLLYHLEDKDSFSSKLSLLFLILNSKVIDIVSDLKGLRYSNEIINEVVDYVQRVRYLKSLEGTNISLSVIKRFLALKNCESILNLYKIFLGETDLHKNLSHCYYLYDYTTIKPDPFITGDDLIELGYKPGPAFSKVIEEIYDLQLENKLQEKEKAKYKAMYLMSKY